MFVVDPVNLPIILAQTLLIVKLPRLTSPETNLDYAPKRLMISSAAAL